VNARTSGKDLGSEDLAETLRIRPRRAEGLGRRQSAFVAQPCYYVRTKGLTMSTTTIRLDDDLKERISAAADLAGKTAHAFIVDAIARTVEQVEAEEELHRIAEKRWAKLLATGNSVPWDDAKKYLAARGRGEKPVKPTARKLEH